MQTDSTEVGDKPHARDGEFTQAWDTVGAGAISQTRVRESLTKMSEKLLLTMKLSVSYAGNKRPRYNFEALQHV